jgi:anti-anti-sigma regulatory factor
MSMTLSKSGSLVKASLSGELTIVDAATIYGELFAKLDGEASLVIEAAGVTRIDASIAQVFLFAAHCVRDCHVESRSSAWENALGLLGPNSLVADPC